MKSFLGISLLIAASLILTEAASYNRTIFDDVNGPIVPHLPHFSLTVPGTKWCGFGNVSREEDDLGLFNKTDICCKAHKVCQDVIEPFGSMHSLENPSILPKFHCKCEHELFTCLHAVDDMTALVIGHAYFGTMSQCFAEDYPVIKCQKYQHGALGRRCILYQFDPTKEREYQFFDMPFFTFKEE